MVDRLCQFVLGPSGPLSEKLAWFSGPTKFFFSVLGRFGSGTDLRR